ncbi:MAG: DJ-1/PfpI family protein, partial [Mycoplasmataceae bacterium]|nr:DJ-1/PfpI family protein [Mycoplasmataceae bacterium]
MKKVLVLVQTNYEDTELITTLNALSRKKIAYDLYSPEKLDIVKGETGSMIETQKEFDGTNYDALFVPGGTAAEVMTHNPEVIEIVKSFNKEG